MQLFDEALQVDNEDITINQLETYTLTFGALTALSAWLAAFFWSFAATGVVGHALTLASAATAFLSGMIATRTFVMASLFKDIYFMDRGARERQEMQNGGGQAP